MRRVLVVLVLAFACLGVAGPAQASPGATVVKGLQAPDTEDRCAPPPGTVATYWMSADPSGGLLGCWYIDEFNVDAYHPSGTGVFSGTETFVGCIDANGDDDCDGASGTFHTTYTFTAKFDNSSGAELHGRCHHPITTGTGLFENAKGLINFTDNVDDGSADYSGPISL